MSGSNSFAWQTINFVKLTCLPLSRPLKYFSIFTGFGESYKPGEDKSLPWWEITGRFSAFYSRDRKCILGRNNF